MSLTLVEARKLHSGDVYRAAYIEMFARSTDILRVLTFENITGGALRYNREETLPGVGYRGINEGYTESTGILNPIMEPLLICGGDLDVDRALIKTMGEDQRTVQEAMKIKAIGLHYALKFIKGDQESDPKEPDGLQIRLAGNQLLDAGATSGGDALSLAKLDELYDAVLNPTHWIMNKALRRRLTAAARLSTVGGYITYEKDEFGIPVTKYADLPILIMDEDNTGTQILPFTEANPGGGTAASTSIYCVSIGDGMLTGIQNGDLEVEDLGQIDSDPVYRTRIEWLNGIALFHGKAAARLQGITNAAVTV